MSLAALVPPAPTRPEILTVKEYADRHRVHVQTVYTAIRDQRLPENVTVVRPTRRTIRLRLS